MKLKLAEPRRGAIRFFDSYALANMLPNIFWRATHTGYTPKGAIVTASLSSLKEILKDFGVEQEEGENFEEQITEAIKLAVNTHPKHFEYALYRDPRNPSHTELGLRFHLNPKS